MRNNVAMSDGAETLGSIATGALIAREVERARADRPAIGHSEHEACANCGTIRMGPYCQACGQAGHVHRNVGALAHDIAHGVFHFEGKLWHTLPLLAWHPGRLTRRYVDGERAKFVSPMALFLFSVFLMFAVVSHLAGHSGALEKELSVGAQLSDARTKLATLEAKRAKETDIEDQHDLDARIVEQRTRVAALDQAARTGTSTAGPGGSKIEFKKADINTGIPGLDSAISHAAENPQLLLYKLKMNAYKYSWALIPISLPFLWLLFPLRRDVGLYDHAIFAIYSLSFMSLGVVALVVLGKLGLPTAITALAAIVVPPVHMYRQLKGTYRLGWFGTTWRTIALLFITAITSSLFFALLLYLGTE